MNITEAGKLVKGDQKVKKLSKALGVSQWPSGERKKRKKKLECEGLQGEEIFGRNFGFWLDDWTVHFFYKW